MRKCALFPALTLCAVLYAPIATCPAAPAKRASHAPSDKHHTVAEQALWHLHEGQRLLKLGRDTEALSHLNEGLRLNPDSVEIMEALGTWHFHEGARLIKQGQEDDAIEHLDEAARLQPRNDQMQKAALKLRAERSLWRFNEGQRLQKLGQNGDAVVQWEAAVRLNPNNLPARQVLKVYNDQVSVAAIAGAKKALAEFGLATNFSEITDVLTDKSASSIGAELLFQERVAAMELALKPPASLNATMADDFEAFMQVYRLYGVIAQRDLVGLRNVHSSDYPTPGLQGRALMRELAKWAGRLHRSRVDLILRRPFRINRLAEHQDKFQFTVHDGGWVDIDGTNLDDQVPLEARFEDGEWRIGARDGWQFHYAITTNNSRYSEPEPLIPGSSGG